MYCLLLAALIAAYGAFQAQQGHPADAVRDNAKVSATMDKPAIPPAQPLSADVVTRIGEPGINMLVVRLVQLEARTAMEGELEIEIGPAWFVIGDVLAGDVFTRGETIGVPIKRIRDIEIRSRTPANHWNNLSLEPGSKLVMACRARQGEFCNPSAALEIRSANTSDV